MKSLGVQDSKLSHQLCLCCGSSGPPKGQPGRSWEQLMLRCLQAEYLLVIRWTLKAASQSWVQWAQVSWARSILISSLLQADGNTTFKPFKQQEHCCKLPCWNGKIFGLIIGRTWQDHLLYFSLVGNPKRRGSLSCLALERRGSRWRVRYKDEA